MSERIISIQNKYEAVTDQIIIITEGKTDITHLKTAFSGLNLPTDNIDYYDFMERETLGGDELKKLLSKLSKIHNPNIIIGIFDRDKHVEPCESGKSFSCLGNNVYRFNIPVLSNDERNENDLICIEHYYTNDEIRKNTGKGHLYLAQDFDKYGVSKDGKWLIQDYQKNRSLSPITIIDGNNSHLQEIKDNAKIATKAIFADYVSKNPTKFDFSNFKLIYDVICEIKKDAKKNRESL